MRLPDIIPRPVPDFSEIYGLENVKQILMDACKSRHSIAILLWGPPQSSKTLFLEAIARYFRFNEGVPYTLDRATPAGLAELFTNRYVAYVFDEIDKAKTDTLRVFNEAVEHKRISFIKHNTSIIIKLREDTKFFVGANSLSVIKERVPEVVTRFLDIPLPPMTFNYFKEIVYLQLQKYGYTREQSDTIAVYAWNNNFRDVRKIRELGKIYNNGKLDDVIRFIDYWTKTKTNLLQQEVEEKMSQRTLSQIPQKINKSNHTVVQELEKIRKMLRSLSKRNIE